MASQPLTIAVVGGGFGGSYFLKELERLHGLLPPFQVLLFEPRSSFVFTPLLHELATAGLEKEHLLIPYARIFSGKEWIGHVREAALRIDRKRHLVITKSGSHRYDYLLLATGSQTNYYGNAGAEKHALPLKTEQDALRLRLRLKQALLDAAQAKGEGQAKELAVIVGGGGPTGVELAPEILQFLRHRIRKQYRMITADAPSVTLLQGADALLPMAKPCLREGAAKALAKMGVRIVTGAYVERLMKGGVAYRKGGELHCEQAAILVWVAGVSPTVVAGLPGKRYETDQDLFLHGEERIMAIGDAACFHEHCRLAHIPTLAQAAVQQGRHAARNLVARINGRATAPFTYRSQGFLFSLGQRRAMGELTTPFGSLCLRGFFAWWLWRTIYLFKFLDARQRVTVAGSWTARLFTGRSLAKRGLHGQKSNEEGNRK